MPTAPAAEYRLRLDRNRLAFERLNRLDARLAGARLAVFGVAVAAAALAWFAFASAWWLAAPAVAFLGLAVWHDRVLRARERAAAAMAFYDHGLARIEDRWAGLGSTGDAFRDNRHPYEADLDLFGPASLFELLSIARTQSGEATLAGWLKTAAAPDEIAARQQAVQELTPALDLREHLAASTAAARRQVEPGAAPRVGTGPPGAQSPGTSRCVGNHRGHAAGGAHVRHHRFDHAAPFHVGGAVGLRAAVRAAGARRAARRRRARAQPDGAGPDAGAARGRDVHRAAAAPAAAAHRGAAVCRPRRRWPGWPGWWRCTTGSTT